MIKKQYNLTPEVCDEISEEVMSFCDRVKTDRKDKLRYRLSVEECLLSWLDKGCEGRNLTFIAGKRLFRNFIKLEMDGEAVEPFSAIKEDYGDYCDSFLVYLNLRPEYSYTRGKNNLLYRINRKSPGQLTVLCITILIAMFVGLLGKFLLPPSVIGFLLNDIVTPFYDTFFNILGCVAGPMVFLSVCWGIYGIGDIEMLGRIGRGMLIRFVGMTFLVSLGSMVVFPILGPGLSGSSEGGSQVQSILKMVLDIFPSNIVSPFVDGNILQIIFLAIVIGIALLYLGRQTRAIATAIEQINLMVQFLMNVISKIVPFIVFLVIINLIWSDTASQLDSVWKLIIVIIAAHIVAGFLFILGTSIRRKVNFVTLLKKVIPSFLIAFTSASSAASFSSNVTTCKKSYGIDDSLTGFGIPLGMVMHKPISAMYNSILVIYFAGVHHVSCSVGWLLIAVFICAIVSIATPPVPGGGAIAYSILFTQLGIPMEALAIAFTIDLIADFMITAFEMLALQMTMINVSSSMNLIDSKVLRS